MRTSRQLLIPVLNIAIGFVVGLGTANYFSATGHNEDKVIAVSPSRLENAKTGETRPLPIAPGTSEKTAAAILRSATQDSVTNDTRNGDISLSEAIEIRKEPNINEPSPEELIKNQPIELVAIPRFSSQEIHNLEGRLRWESENNAPLASVGNEGLLEHERR